MNLKTYDFPALDGGKYAVVICPHCDGEFTVEGKRWRAPLMSAVRPDVEVQGRSCPYCQKVSLIPLEFFPRKERARRAADRAKVAG